MTYEEYLAHEGILGMKWGHRNGPPYPLTRSRMSSAERANADTPNESERSKNGREFVRNFLLSAGAMAVAGLAIYKGVKSADVAKLAKKAPTPIKKVYTKRDVEYWAPELLYEKYMKYSGKTPKDMAYMAPELVRELFIEKYTKG